MNLLQLGVGGWGVLIRVDLVNEIQRRLPTAGAQ